MLSIMATIFSKAQLFYVLTRLIKLHVSANHMPLSGKIKIKLILLHKKHNIPIRIGDVAVCLTGNFMVKV